MEDIDNLPIKPIISRGFDWQNEWRVPIEFKYVRFAESIIKNLTGKELIHKGIEKGKNYEIPNVCVKGFSSKDKQVKNRKGQYVYKDKGAIFLYDDDIFHLLKSSYRIRFSIPKSQLLDYETEEFEYTQTIKITGWAYENCYKKAINRILEDWGKYMYGLSYMTSKDCPMYKSSCYRYLIQKIRKIDISFDFGNDNISVFGRIKPEETSESLTGFFNGIDF